MKTRTLTGAVILLVTLGFVLLKQFSALFFDAFALILIYASLFEVIRAHKKMGNNSHSLVLWAVPALEFVAFLVARRLFAARPERILLGSGLACLLLAVVALVLSMSIDLISAKAHRDAGEPLACEKVFAKTKTTMTILAYPILPLSFFLALNSLPYDAAFYGIALTFVVAMMTDTFAYLFGKFFGKTKFIPEVSPNKTVAGVVGGFVGGLVGSALCFVLFYFTPWLAAIREISLFSGITAFAVVGLLGAFLTQLGDLIESALKRKAGLKDMGNIFPGHGGFMDRVDGQMFVSVLAFLVMCIFFV